MISTVLWSTVLLSILIILILVNQNQNQNQIQNNQDRVAGGSDPTIPDYKGVTTSTNPSITIKDSTGINPYSVETLLHQTYSSLKCQSNSGYEKDYSSVIRQDGSKPCTINEASLLKSTSTSTCIYGTSTSTSTYTCIVDRSGGGSADYTTNRKKGLPCNTHTDCHRFYTMTCEDNQCSSPFMDSRKYMDFPNSLFATNSPVRKKTDP